MAAVPGHPHDGDIAASDGAVREMPAVIAPGHSFESVTDKISGIVLTKRTRIGWFFGLAIGVRVTDADEYRHRQTAVYGHRGLR